MNLLLPARGRRAFVLQLPHSSRLLDVGCGCGSPEFVKSIRSDIYYVGLDVVDYEQTERAKSMADKYVIVDAEQFDNAITQLGDSSFDVVMSRHNLEHCIHPDEVLTAMCAVLRPGGLLFLSFPSEASVDLPSRKLTLNFYDDPTHRAVPIWRNVLDKLEQNGMRPIFASPRYRPWAAFIVGLVCEPIVAPFGRQAPKCGTWALYGFESVIWAQKRGL